MELVPLGAFIKFVHLVPEHEVQFRTTETEEELFFFGLSVSHWEMFCCCRHVKFCGPFEMKHWLYCFPWFPRDWIFLPGSLASGRIQDELTFSPSAKVRFCHLDTSNLKVGRWRKVPKSKSRVSRVTSVQYNRRLLKSWLKESVQSANQRNIYRH